MKNNYILVDFENIQNIDLESIRNKSFYVKIFVGTNQTKIPIDLVLKSQELLGQIEWIQINGSGKNALDFHIAFVLGKITQKDPEAFFHIISKDTGFDPLIAYIKDQKILCKRSTDISAVMDSIMALSTSDISTKSSNQTNNLGQKLDKNSNNQTNKQASEESFQLVCQKLTSLPKQGRPKSGSSLRNHIKSILCLKEMTIEVDAIYQKLLSSKKICINQAQKIEYKI